MNIGRQLPSFSRPYLRQKGWQQRVGWLAAVTAAPLRLAASSVCALPLCMAGQVYVAGST